MNPGIVQAIFRKEILDTLRDKRTLVAMIIIPVLLYPALFIFASQAAIFQTDRLSRETSQVALLMDSDGVVAELLKNVEGVVVSECADPQLELSEGMLDAFIKVGPAAGAAIEAGGAAEIYIYYDATRPESNNARSRLVEGFQKQEENILLERLKTAGIEASYVDPLAVKSENLASPAKVTGSLLGSIIPLVMVLMVALGAFYPAVDLTAGEKERGTFETLLSTPTAKLEIVTGKFMAVFCLAMFTGLLNLGSMTLTFALQLAQLPAELNTTLELRLPPETLLLMLLVLVPLAFFISAVMMTLAVFARNFKEAQNYLMPVFVALLFPAAFAAMPGMTLTPVTQLFPIANVCLLFKGMMMGEFTAQGVFVVFLSMALYALLSLLAAAWIFQREEVMLAEDNVFPFSFNRTLLTRRESPSPSMSLFLYATALLLVFYAGGYLQARSNLLGILLTQWVLILVPPLFLFWYAKIDVAAALNLRLPSPLTAIGCLLVAPAWAVLLLQFGVWQQALLPLPPELQEAMSEMIQQVEGKIGLWGLLFSVAVSPAICEEILFRGALLSGLKKRLPLWAGVLLIGLLFGMIHFSIYRLPATMLSGFILTYLVWRSGSVYLSMATHFFVNGTALLVHENQLPGVLRTALAEPLNANSSLHPALIAVAALALVCGIGIIEWGYPRRSDGY